ncbi:MAG: DUF4491 family protein [Tissierellia bacterium]|nr:DUF4491 family protein [Tissierellia bacterium]
MKMNFKGLIIGGITFLLIGLFHPIVIKCEYFFGRKSWVFFLMGGMIFSGISVIVDNLYGSLITGVLACCFFWSIKEIFEQEVRVLKGWFPKNPQREAYYEKIQNQLKEEEKKFTQ